MIRRPSCNFLSDDLIERSGLRRIRTSLRQHETILKLAAARVGSLYENKETLLLLLAYLDKRLHAVRTEVRIDRGKILFKTAAHGLSDLHLPQVPHRVSLGGRADIAALDVPDHDKPLLLTVGNRLLKSVHALHAELLIHGDLRLYRRNEIAYRIHDTLIEQPDRFRRAFHGFSVLGKSLLFDILRHKLHGRVKSHHNGRLQFLDLLCQCINQSFLPSKSFSTYWFSIYFGKSFLFTHS